MLKNSTFFENFNRNTRKFLKIPEILVFFDKINPYKKNRVSDVDGRVLEKQWVVHYRAFVPWLVDIHINGLLIIFVAWLLLGQSFGYLYLVADGLALWLIPTILSLMIAPFKDGAKEIVRELPR